MDLNLAIANSDRWSCTDLSVAQYLPLVLRKCSCLEALYDWRDFVRVEMTVNGSRVSHDIEPRLLLVYYLREFLGLTGTNIGCDTSSCGACTVLLDGESVKSCTVFALQADGASITTIEGMADGDELHPIQAAFHEHHALQCGYCTPGMVMAIASFLAEHPNPSEAEVREGLEGNLCRCTGYQNIVAAAIAASRSPDLSRFPPARPGPSETPAREQVSR